MLADAVPVAGCRQSVSVCEPAGTIHLRGQVGELGLCVYIRDDNAMREVCRIVVGHLPVTQPLRMNTPGNVPSHAHSKHT